MTSLDNIGARCRHCENIFYKTDKRQRCCRTCSELSRLEQLPHQIARRNERGRKHAAKKRRERGDTLFKGRRICCAVCKSEFETRGIAHKYCDTCGPIVAKQNAERSEAKRIRHKRPVGSTLNCRRCDCEFVKVGVHQAYCSPECKEANWKANPRNVINSRVNALIRNALGGKGGVSWQTMVGYTLDELIAHLERQFLPGMSWENRGRWHVDHVVPRSSFQFETAADPEFTACWAISNLRPMWAKDNLSKSSKRTHLL